MTLNGVMTHRNFTEIFGVRKLQSLGHHEALLVMAALCNRGALYFCPVISIYLSIFFFFSSPNLSGSRLDVYHTLTHGVALVRI